MNLRYLLSIFAFVICSFSASAQVVSEYLRLNDPKQVHIILTKRGDTMEGRLIAKDKKTLTFLLKNKFEITLQRSEVVYILVKGKDKGALDRYSGAFKSKITDSSKAHTIPYLFTSSTSYTLKKGEMLYRNIGVLYNAMDYGVSDNIQIGLGIAPVVVWNLFTFDAKYGFDIDNKSRIGIGFKGISQVQVDFNNGPNVAQNVPYLAYTYGNKKSFLNYNLAFGLKLREQSLNSMYHSIGFSHQVTPKWRAFGEINITINEKGFGDRNSSSSASFIGLGIVKDYYRLDFGMLVYVGNSNFLGSSRNCLLKTLWKFLAHKSSAIGFKNPPSRSF